MRSLVIAGLVLGIFCQQSFGAPCDVEEYYPGLETLKQKDGVELRNALHDLIKDHTIIPYTSSSQTDCWDALGVVDSRFDPQNVWLIYANIEVDKDIYGTPETWNREHVWPKSYGIFTDGADTSDLHSLRASDANVNSARSNLYFDVCVDKCTSPAHKEAAVGSSKNSTVFQPPEISRGAIARSLFYMAVRYDGSDPDTTDLELTNCPDSSRNLMGKLDTLLKWHLEFPPDAFEIRRNNLLCSDYQGNRNPFIDHPEFAMKIFSVENYEDPVVGCARSAITTTPSLAGTVQTSLTTMLVLFFLFALKQL